MYSHKHKDGSLTVALLGSFMLAVMALCSAIPPAYADDPAGAVAPQSAYRVALDGEYRGGSLGGYGKSYALAASSTPAIAYTTSVSADGLHMVDFINSGSSVVLISLNAATVSTAACQVYLPASTSYRHRSKTRVTYFRYYCPTGTSTLVVAE